MKYEYNKREIKLNRKLSELDKFVIDFIRILRKHVDYVIISGYISILLGRSRATEDIDLFIRKISFEQFLKLFGELKEKGFSYLNAEDPKDIFSYLQSGMAARFSREEKPIPNFKIKFPKRKVNEETFLDFITVILPEDRLKISSLERQVAFKKYYLKSDKDIEDALHIEEIFKDDLNYEKIDKLRDIIGGIEND